MKTSVSAKEEKLSVGDKVVITLDAEIVEAMQTGHGEWNLDMKEVSYPFQWFCISTKC